MSKFTVILKDDHGNLYRAHVEAKDRYHAPIVAEEKIINEDPETFDEFDRLTEIGVFAGHAQILNWNG